MPPLSYSKALCLSSLLLLDFCTLENSVEYYQLRLFTNYFLDSMTKDTMDSHIHSVLACSLKYEEHCTKRNGSWAK